jgi:YHS domain-containing protein
MKILHNCLAAALFCAVVLFAVSNALSADHKGKLQRSVPGGAAPLQQMKGQKVFFEDQDSSVAIKQNLDDQGVILKGYDAVAYFKERKPVKGNPDFSTVYRGARYLFVSAANKAEFDENPAKYAPQYGAFCAYGVAMGVLADPEVPDAFLIYKGKLYVCGNQGALKDFRKDLEDNVVKANNNWQQLAKP